MPLYQYSAYNAFGKRYKSALESPSIEKAKAKLLELNISFIDLKEKKKRRRKKIPLDQILQFSEQLAQLLKADLPLYESLNLLRDQFTTSSMFEVIDSLCQSLKRGETFSYALEKLSGIFSRFYISLVTIGEESGHLDEALTKICGELKRELRLKKQILSALLYPALLMFFSLLLVTLLIFYVVPSIEKLYETQNCHFFTRCVINGALKIKKYGIWAPPIFLCIAVYVSRLFKKKKFQFALHKFLLRAPILKNLLIEIELARFSSTLSLLLVSNITLLEGLSLSCALVNNLLLKGIFLKCIEKIKEGDSFSSEIKKSALFPPLFYRLIKIGESSGELSSSFTKLAMIYHESVDKRLKKLLTLLSPCILIFMAIFIGVIMLAILIPLTDINAFSN